MPNETADHRPTLMTVHAHPDDETIGTGGTMATAFAEGRRFGLVPCPPGEVGELVVPGTDPPETHRPPAGIRAGAPRAASEQSTVDRFVRWRHSPRGPTPPQ